jgi:hypothetical protein
MLEDTISAGTRIGRVGGRPIPEAYRDGNHVIETKRDDVSKRQLNLLAAYAAFYDPRHILKSFLEYGRDSVGRKRFVTQIWGSYGLVMTAVKTLPWIWQLKRGPVETIRAWPRHSVRLVDAKTRQDVSWSVNTRFVAPARSSSARPECLCAAAK